jgi:hypothetical protein
MDLREQFEKETGLKPGPTTIYYLAKYIEWLESLNEESNKLYGVIEEQSIKIKLLQSKLEKQGELFKMVLFHLRDMNGKILENGSGFRVQLDLSGLIKDIEAL